MTGGYRVQNMLDLKKISDGVILPIQAQPKARQNAVVGIHNGHLKVAVTLAPEKGKANAAILKVLAAVLGIRRSQLKIVSGKRSIRKNCLITGLQIEELRRRLFDDLGSEA